MANVRWPLTLARATGGLSTASSSPSSPGWQNEGFGSLGELCVKQRRYFEGNVLKY